MSDEFPTIREEIERKAVSTAIYMLEQRDLGNISEGELYFGQIVLFNTVSGLIGNDVFTLISANMPESIVMPELESIGGKHGGI